MAISDQTIFSAAPLFFRLKTEGYFDPEDEFTEEDRARRAELGLPEYVQERRYPPITDWGIECPDAWFEIVLDAVTTIEAALHEIVAAGVAVDDLPGCTQIKGKFGGLRLYWRTVEGTPSTQAMLDALDQAEARVLRLPRRVR